MISVDKLLLSVLQKNKGLAEVARCYQNIKRLGLSLHIGFYYFYL